MTQRINFRNQVYESIARQVIKEYDPSLLSNPQAIPIEDIAEKQYGLTIEYQFIRSNGRILGETIFDDTLLPIYDNTNKEYTLIYVKSGTIIIDASLLYYKNDGRLRFTCTHELAHWILHKNIYSGSGQTAAMINKEKTSSNEDVLIERQADMLSSCLLMPGGQVKMAFYNSLRLTSDIVEYLANQFAVSKQAMHIRLKSLNLV